jgi:hypothetical protein
MFISACFGADVNPQRLTVALTRRKSVSPADRQVMVTLVRDDWRLSWIS